jgi:energy-coupling factor transport system permease protein
LFRIIFNSGLATEKIAFVMPELNVGGVHLLGAVAWPTLLAATNDGLRLAAIIVTIGMANTLANPKRLLKSTPGALYEVATAMTVAINLAPQLIESLQRVRKARNLRGRSKGISALHSIVIPALEDTIEQSLALAASMDARGFGRRGNLTSFQTVLSRALSLGGILLITFGAYFLLATNMQVLAISLFAIGVAALAVTIKIASSRNLRTRYRRQKPGWRDGVIALASLTAVALAVFV